MTIKSFLLTASIADYLTSHNPALDKVEEALIAQTQQLGDVASMQIAPEQGAFMTLLTRMLDVRFAVEVGTFTGYSALCIARGLPPEGKLLCCDVSEEWTTVARRHWEMAGLTERIELRIAPALQTLQALPRDRAVDLAFIDADKKSYTDYYEELVPRLRPGGVILVDNVLWSGDVANPAVNDENTIAIRAFNDHVAADKRVDSVILPIADG